LAPFLGWHLIIGNWCTGVEIMMADNRFIIMSPVVAIKYITGAV
jgi:hypothetical protein